MIEHFSTISCRSDITQSLVLTEMGLKKDPEHFKTMMDNIQKILKVPVHG